MTQVWRLVSVGPAAKGEWGRRTKSRMQNMPSNQEVIHKDASGNQTGNKQAKKKKQCGQTQETKK